MYERVSALIPQGILNELKKQFIYNNIRLDERKFGGFLLIHTFLLSLGIALNAYFIFLFNPVIAFFVSFIGIVALAYLLLKMSSEGKGKFVENILPDALQLIASNMKSGLTTERSLFVAGRPEFGPLQYELKNASKKISSGERIEIALKGIGDAINSGVLSKTLWLISRGIKSGGQIADLLFQLSDDLKSQQALEEEARSNISIYILLIFFAAVFGAPVLFGISSFIVEILAKQLASTPSIDPSSLPASSSLGPIKSLASGAKSAIGPEFVRNFSMITLVFTTVFSCLTIGVINSGKETNGIKYVIPLLIVAFLVFFTVRFGLGLVFGNLV